MSYNRLIDLERVILSKNLFFFKQYLLQFFFIIILVSVSTSVLLSNDAFSASTGSGTLTVTDDGLCNGDGFSDFRFPKWWDVFQDGTVHLNITPGFMICTSGVDINKKCNAASDCSTTNGQCQSNANTGTCGAQAAGTCTVGGNIGTSCTANNNCTTVTGTCSSGICTTGKVGQSCSSNPQCNLSGVCTLPPRTCTVGNIGATCSNNTACNTKSCAQNAPAHPGGDCTTTGDAFCNIAGTCESALECSGPASVFVAGIDGNACEEDTDCTETNETGCNTGTCDNNICSLTGDDCTTDADCTGFCEFKDEIEDSGRTDNGDIDVCYDTPAGMCLDANVYYCDEETEANVHVAAQGQSFVATLLRAVASTDGEPCTEDSDCEAPGATAVCDNGTCDSPITQCGSILSDCTNEVGSFCCGLSQGAYGAPKSIATALPTGIAYGSCGPNSEPAPGSGFLPAAACLGCDAFDGDPNGTTIGIHLTRSLTLDNLNTLIAYLPSGGTPGIFKTNLIGADTHYDAPSDIPDPNPGNTNSKGEGAGVLAGQTMACALNTFLSNCDPPFGGNGSFTGSGFDNFKLPASGAPVCTKRSGPDKVLGTGDDICQAFSYPSCVATKTVAEVNTCANQYLATGASSCNCSASDLNVALDNINNEFDGCGEVVACPQGVVSGVFSCQ